MHGWLGCVRAYACQGVCGVAVCVLRVSVWGVCVLGVFRYASVCIACMHVFHI